jgi:hypothetical protein
VHGGVVVELCTRGEKKGYDKRLFGVGDHQSYSFD